MFLPMSWTSPFTVASSTRPALRDAPASSSASRNGTSQATAFFMTRALFTTWGRNMRPSPKRSPTTFIPSMRGPSMTLRARPSSRRAASVSSSTQPSIPWTRAWDRRSATGSSRQDRSSSRSVSRPWSVSAIRVRRSVAPSARRNRTSSTASLRSPGMSS